MLYFPLSIPKGLVNFFVIGMDGNKKTLLPQSPDHKTCWQVNDQSKKT